MSVVSSRASDSTLRPRSPHVPSRGGRPTPVKWQGRPGWLPDDAQCSLFTVPSSQGRLKSPLRQTYEPLGAPK